MKSNVFKFLSIAIATGLLLSCGGQTTEDNDPHEDNEVAGPSFASECTADNEVFFQLENYGYQYDTNVSFNGNLDIVRTEWLVKNDSTAELKMYNYELGAPDTTSNYQVYVEFHSKNGEKLQSGSYAYNDWDANLWSKVNIISSTGTVYFNWSMGMPKQGHVLLNYFDDDNACGEFVLEVNKPEVSTIGRVILKGSWKTVD